MSLDDLAFFFKGIAEHYVQEEWNFGLHFVLHGGEPILLPMDFFRGFVKLQRKYLAAQGIPYRTSLQTNLTHVNESLIDLLEELNVNMGISLDIFGGERLTIAGEDSRDHVLDNLQKMYDLDAVRRLSMGAITVMHGGNVQAAVETFNFFNELGMSYRILPVFSLTDPVSRMQHLVLSAGQVVEALKEVVLAHASSGSDIEIYPLREFYAAAVHYVSGSEGRVYDPSTMEWALIIDTNGDAYNHSEAYTQSGIMGNIFRDPLTQILNSKGRERTLALRAERARTCKACLYGSCCNRIPIIEALPSERRYSNHALECGVARPMIDFIVGQIKMDSNAMEVVKRRGTQVSTLQLTPEID